MNLRALSISAMAVAFLSMIGTVAARADMVYAIGDGGASLLRFDTSSPGLVSRVAFFNGADTFLDSIDFRPATGQLYGYRDFNDTYYTVNLTTGQLTSATTLPVGATTNTFLLGMDWNPTIDRLRVVTDSTQNLVYNPNTGTAAGFTNLFYGAGDVNAGVVPLVIENAYTNNFAGATSTQQYVLDYDQNSLATLANNAGTLATVGKIMLNGGTLDFDEYAGFDVATVNGVNTAYALLTVNNVAGFYSIDLATGNATSLGALGTGFGQVYGLSVAAVPEPSALVLAATGLAAFATSRLARRRRHPD
ncbi:MAG: DUF4394 domain-containing protein [Isosphaeraceae bacterium]